MNVVVAALAARKRVVVFSARKISAGEIIGASVKERGEIVESSRSKSVPRGYRFAIAIALAESHRLSISRTSRIALTSDRVKETFLLV